MEYVIDFRLPNIYTSMGFFILLHTKQIVPVLPTTSGVGVIFMPEAFNNLITLTLSPTFIMF